MYKGKVHFLALAWIASIGGAVFISAAEAHQLQAHGKESVVAQLLDNNTDATRQAEETPASPSSAFPVQLGGPFSLIDQNGVPRTDREFHGRYVLLFFGYVNCQYMCSLTLKNMAAAVDDLGELSGQIQPILITVDPEFDTQAILRRELRKIHPRMIGLSGSKTALAKIYAAYKIKPTVVGLNERDEAVVSHTSYLYLLDREGRLLTLLPPILSAPRMAGIIAGYIR